MRTIDECIKYLEGHIVTCDYHIRFINDKKFKNFEQKEAYEDFAIKQKEAYEDCIKYLKSYKELKSRFSDQFKDFSMDKYMEDKDDYN